MSRLRWQASERRTWSAEVYAPWSRRRWNRWQRRLVHEVYESPFEAIAAGESLHRRACEGEWDGDA